MFFAAKYFPNLPQTGTDNAAETKNITRNIPAEKSVPKQYSTKNKNKVVVTASGDAFNKAIISKRLNI